MKKVYKCEYCNRISDAKEEIIEHEKSCGYNPKNKIDDKIILKLAHIHEHFIDSLKYVLLEDYKDKLDYFKSEFERATESNCSYAVYEQKDAIRGLIIDIRCLQKDKLEKWFKNLTERDNPELIEAIRMYFKNPEYRIKSKRGDKQ